MGLTRRDPQDRPSSSTSVPTTRLLLLERRELDPSSLLPRNQRPRSLLLKNQRPRNQRRLPKSLQLRSQRLPRSLLLRNQQLRSPPRKLDQRRSKLASFQNRNMC